jgi:nucleoside-diphosphate-sugar epimerase
MPHIKSNLKPFPFFLDVENGKAVVPGTGEDKFTVTYSEDLARMIVRLLDAEEKWPPVAFLSGSDISLNEVIASVKEVRGMYPECLTLQLLLTWSYRLQD